MLNITGLGGHPVGQRCRPDSDIDIGLVMMPGFDISEKELDPIEARIREGLSPLGTHKFDLIFLTLRAVFFSNKAIRSGKLIYARDMDVITDFHRVRQQYTQI